MADEAEVDAELAAALAATEGMEGMEGLEHDDIEALEAMQAAAGLEAGDVPAEEEEEEDDDGVEVEDHLKEGIDGSLRLKRLLSRDEDEAQPGKKKRKVGSIPAAVLNKMKKILLKWGLTDDVVVRHVLEQQSLEELDELDNTNYAPDKFNMWKSPAELLARFVQEMKERKMPGGAQTDCVAAFKFKFKLDMEADKKLRALTHKELRFVMDNYTTESNLDELITEAETFEPEDENATEWAVPTTPGASTMSRFARLELIDPLADCAVFGDANLTFALKLAAHRKALGHVGRVIATTFEDLPTLRERYPEIDDSIKILEDHYAEVYHCVDCTRIAIDGRFKGMENTLGAVYYNFPHSGAVQGFFDGHPVVNWRHENLMRLFFRALRNFMKPGGVVKVASNMGAVGVRYSYIVGGAIENEFIHSETMQFLEWHLHRYGRSYGDKRDAYKRPDAKNNESYNAQRAEADMVYCFKYAPTGATLGPQPVRLPPTLTTLKNCTDGPFKNMFGTAKDNLAATLHKRFVTEVSGTHVG